MENMIELHDTLTEWSGRPGSGTVRLDYDGDNQIRFYQRRKLDGSWTWEMLCLDDAGVFCQICSGSRNNFHRVTVKLEVLVRKLTGMLHQILDAMRYDRLHSSTPGTKTAAQSNLV